MPAVGIDINLFWQIINFVILVFVFKKFFHKPLNDFLETRREKIAGELTQAKKDREEAVTLNEEAAKAIKEAKINPVALCRKSNLAGIRLFFLFKSF